MKVITQYEMRDLSQLVVGAKYQRDIKECKVIQIKKSIEKYGFFPFYPLIITSSNLIIDGQHRFVAAERCNLLRLPVTVVDLDSTVDEATFFSDINMFNTKLSTVDFWHARYLCHHPVAKMIYFLNESSNSKLYNKIAIKGHHTKKSRFSIGIMLNLMLYLYFYYDRRWSTSNDEAITKMFLEANTLAILAKVNEFIEFFFVWAGVDKKQNPMPYRADSVEVIVLFYRKLLKNNFTQKELLEKVAPKMQNFIFSNDWKRVTQIGRLSMLVNYFNFKRRNKLTLTIE